MPVEPPIVTPRSLDDAYAVLAEAPHRPIAGGTDVMVQLTGELGPVPERMVDLWRLDELRGIGLDGDSLVLGALTTFSEIRRSPLCRDGRCRPWSRRRRRSARRRSRTAPRSAATR